ncbi:MAG: VOC family protein, partial [Alphaproteobacteria bacterium]|nr:VOC family protein [Alphaproteobacteria bacterium]
MSKLTDRTVFQNAWVVTDVFEAARKWVDFYGVGPFYVMEHLDLADIKYRGEPGKLDISVALAQAGPVQIELIQQFNPDNSAYRDMY